VFFAEFRHYNLQLQGGPPQNAHDDFFTARDFALSTDDWTKFRILFRRPTDDFQTPPPGSHPWRPGDEAQTATLWCGLILRPSTTKSSFAVGAI